MNIIAVRHYLWTRAAILTSSEPVWLEGGSGLATQLEDAGIMVLKLASFSTGIFKVSALSEIKHSGLRVVVFMAYSDDAIVKHIHQEDMTRGFAWLFQSALTI